MDPVDRLQKMTKAIRRNLLEVLTAEPAARTGLVRRFRDRGDDDVVEMLRALEDDEVLREQVVDVLEESLRSD
jgi:hypothetical protein